MLENSVFFWTFITLVFYLFNCFMQKKLKSDLYNPLVVTIVFSIALILLTKTDYDSYRENTKLIDFFLTPATVCLALPLYEKINILKKNALAITVGIFSGVVTSGVCITIISYAFKLDKEIFASFLPKSVTMAIGVGVSEELGGIVALTAISIVVTGVFGNMVASTVCRIFKITDPIAQGTAIGTSSHAGGTARAVEMGETQGAISGLSIALAGIMTVVVAPIFFSLM